MYGGREGGRGERESPLSLKCFVYKGYLCLLKLLLYFPVTVLYWPDPVQIMYHISVVVNIEVPLVQEKAL